MPITICVSSPAAAHHLPPSKASVERDAGPMIVSCSVCRTRYLVDEKALRGPAGRTVRCASCGHTWYQTAPPELPASEHSASLQGSRIEPAIEVPPRPAGMPAPILEVPPRPRPVPDSSSRPRRSRWAAIRWLLLAVLFALAILAGIVVARGAVVAIWPPAARLYALAGVPVEPLGAGFKIEKLVPARTRDGLIIEGDITNIGKTARDIPRLRVALRDAGEKEVEFRIVDPPQRRLSPGAIAHFKTPFEHPNDAAIGVVVTFVPQ
jgi:predicted Zn finger-like uncharacterized protein